MSAQNSPAPVAALTPLKIEVSGPGRYKSIDELLWDNVPPFAVLTGLNGSGKTQLLELLAYKLSETPNPFYDLREVTVTVSGDKFVPGEVAYMPNRWEFRDVPPLGLAQLTEMKKQYWHSLSNPTTADRSLVGSAKRARLKRLVGDQLVGATDPSERLPADFSYMLEETDVTAGLPYVFMGYRLRRMQEMERRATDAEILKKLGPAPWEVVNETFKAADFPYRVTSPLETGVLDYYELIFEDPHQPGLKLRVGDLSSGETTILGVVMWLYLAQHHGRFPRLFLLDEPDAHLHPSLTRSFLNVIKDVLVDRYKIRVIMATHSPSTVALVPDESIFEMSRTKPRIRPSSSKADTIGRLTSGLVIVSPGTRFVFVEDEGDVKFYENIRDLLSDYGPSRDPRAIRPSPSLVFLRASIGAGKDKLSGGSSVVRQWVEKLDKDPLKEIFRGVIDRDDGNAPTDRVYVLGRYSFENYLYDPFNIYAVLLDERKAPAVPGVSIPIGDEHLIRTLPEPQLQEILNAIRARAEPMLTDLAEAEKANKVVTFTNGKTVKYPGWMIDRRGHDLVPKYQLAFGGPKVISPPRLYSSLHRVRLIPVELADIMDRLQA